MTTKEPREKRVSDIINAAVLEFVEKGYESASMESIALRAGITKGGLYYHFSSKADILLAANNAFMEPIRALMERARRMKKPLDALRFYLRKSIAHWSAHRREIVFTFLSLTKMLTRTDLWPVVDAYMQEMVSFYQSLFDSAVERGDLKRHDTKARAVSMMASLDGISAYVIMCKSLSPDKAAAIIQRTFIDDIALEKNEGKNE